QELQRLVNIGLAAKFDADGRRHTVSRGRRIHLDAIAEDELRFLQPLDAIEDERRRHAEFAGDGARRCPRVLRQRRQNLTIEVVDIGLAFEAARDREGILRLALFRLLCSVHPGLWSVVQVLTSTYLEIPTWPVKRYLRRSRDRPEQSHAGGPNIPMGPRPKSL